MNKSNVLEVNESRWKAAQKSELEFAQSFVNAVDYDNHWWLDAFKGYRVIHSKHFGNVIEVGCGPHTNARLILPLLTFDRLWFEDPLLGQYMKLRQKEVRFRYLRFNSLLAVAKLAHRYHATLLAEKLEDLSLADQSIDLCICINVLDHVQDAHRCLQQVRRSLRPDGVLIIGQDLSNDDDNELCPESWTDIGHPIKIDEEFLESHLGDLSPLYRKVLPREQGRNPKCHYGTYLLIGQNSK